MVRFGFLFFSKKKNKTKSLSAVLERILKIIEKV